MKIAQSGIERFLDNPDPEIGLVLVYGPDKGLAAERCERLCRTVVEDVSDPFSVVELSVADIHADAARLGDEARAVSFGGGKRLVRLRSGADAVSGVLRDYLDNPASDTWIIVDAHELGPRSSLRTLAETHDRAMAIPCYKVEGRELERVIDGLLRELGVSADRDALSGLASRLGDDRGLIRRELEKLAVYAGPESRITAKDVNDCLVDSGEASLERLAFAVGDRNTGEADALLHKTFLDGVSCVAVLRGLQRHFQRLDLVVSQAGSGRPVRALVEALRPRVFYKLRDRFERQARTWPPGRIQRALGALVDAEIACKSTGAPDELICGRTVLALCKMT